MVKNIWPHSKNIECGQKMLNAANSIFELADGLGINVLCWLKLQILFHSSKKNLFISLSLTWLLKVDYYLVYQHKNGEKNHYKFGSGNV